MSLHDAIDKLNQPQVSIPTTTTAATVGLLSASDILTYLSIFVVIMQAIIAWPRFVESVKRWKWVQRVLDKAKDEAGRATGKAAVAALIAGGMALALPHTSAFEGRSLTPYQDIGGVWTVCDGATKGIRLDYVYTDKECDEKTLADLQHAANVVNRYVTVDMPKTRWAAMIDWVYNLGEGNFRRSTMLKKLNAGDVAGACLAIMDWMYVAGKDCRLKESKCGGIPRRREWEMTMCLLPEPEPVAEPPWWKVWARWS